MKYPRKTFFRDYVFFIDENVYNPAEDTFLLAENMKVNRNDFVLDMGTGCGILAIIAAKKARKVLAVDINPYAVKCAKKNAKTNGVKNKVEFLLSDLFQSLRPRRIFDLIVFNAPYLPSELNEGKSLIEKAWAGGSNGRNMIDRFILDAPKFIKPNGRIMLVQSSLSNPYKSLSIFHKLGLEAEITAKVKVPFEEIVLIEARFEN